MGNTRRYRRRLHRHGTALHLIPGIPDDADPKVKDALALRNTASVTGRCPCCGATFETTWFAPGRIGQQVMEHESWCEALTDPPGYTEAVTAELRRLAGEAGR